MTDVELFDRRIAAATNIAPRLDVATLPAPIAEEYQRYLAKIRSTIDSAVSVMPSLAAIHTEFLQGSALNAFAFREERRYFVAINGGLVTVIQATASRMLADPLLFTNVGDPSKETSADLPLFTGLRPDALSIQPYLTQMRRPNDFARDFYAAHIGDIMFDFIAAHELTHIAHGHTDYARTNSASRSFRNSVISLGLRVATSLFRRWKRYGRRFFCRVSADGQHRTHNTRTASPPRTNSICVPESPTAMFNLAVAICILAALRGRMITGVDLSRKCLLPPWRWRQVMMTLNAIANYAIGRWDQATVSQIEGAFSDAITHVERAFQTITGTGLQVTGLNDVWGPPGFSFAQSLMVHWQTELRAKLLKYAKKVLPGVRTELGTTSSDTMSVFSPSFRG